MKPYKELLDLTNRTAIVTGGAKGIGYGIAYRLAEAGANVLIVDIDNETAQKAVKEFTAKGWVADALKADISEERDVKNIIIECKKKFGSIDILVNNAGIYPSKPISKITTEEFERVINVNLKSVFLTTKYASEIMKSQGGGKIINISSIDSVHPFMVGLSHYDASKHGVWGLTKSLALELAEFKISVNAIAPGYVSTNGGGDSADSGPGFSKKERDEIVKGLLDKIRKIPMNRTGQPDDIGLVALFLASDMSNYMTGAQIIVDGGLLLL